jgi:hypothetical protein
VTGAGERWREEVGDHLYSELGGRGLHFDRQRKERLTTGGALRRRAVSQSASMAASWRGGRWHQRRGRQEAGHQRDAVGGGGRGRLRPGGSVHGEALGGQGRRMCNTLIFTRQ